MKNNSTEDILSLAESMIQSGQRFEGIKLLKEFVLNVPPNWKPIIESSDVINGAFWAMNEFLSYIAYRETGGVSKKVVWVTPSYSKAFYDLAFIAVEQENWVDAIKYLNQGLLLESDHPLLLCEKAMVLLRMKKHEEAYNLFVKAVYIRAWAPLNHRAKALRGAAIALIDLKRLDEAKEILTKSLELEPDNKITKNELIYIEHLQREGKSTDKYDLI